MAVRKKFTNGALDAVDFPKRTFLLCAFRNSKDVLSGLRPVREYILRRRSQAQQRSKKKVKRKSKSEAANQMNQESLQLTINYPQKCI